MDKFSITDYWISKYKDHMPTFAYKQKKDEFYIWKKKSQEKLIELLGKYPDNNYSEVKLIEKKEQHGLVIERHVIEIDEYSSFPFITLHRADCYNDKMPVLLCIHGHGLYGKEEIAGLIRDKNVSVLSKNKNENYGELMARKGFFCIIPDMRVFGERRGESYEDRDSCNVNFIKGALMGDYLLTMNLQDLGKCISYAQQRFHKHVKVGAIGLSYGGTLTTFLAALDERIIAADIVGYLNPFYGFAVTRGNFCGSQIVPNIYRYFDTHDIACLIAPKPLLIEMGINDDTFYFEDMMVSYNIVKQCYDDLGLKECLWEDIHEGKHQFAANKSFEFFNKYLIERS